MTDIEKARAYFDNILMDYLEPSEAHAYTLAVDALEKQIPKKAKVEWKDKRMKMTWFSCPICQKIIGYIANTGTDSSSKKYCCYCGQRIDWGDEDENRRHGCYA